MERKDIKDFDAIRSESLRYNPVIRDLQLSSMINSLNVIQYKRSLPELSPQHQFRSIEEMKSQCVYASFEDEKGKGRAQLKIKNYKALKLASFFNLAGPRYCYLPACSSDDICVNLHTKRIATSFHSFMIQLFNQLQRWFSHAIDNLFRIIDPLTALPLC